MDRKKLWSIVKLLLKVTITSFFLYLTFRKIEFKDVKDALSTSDPLFLIIAFGFYLISQIISSSRLNTFFKGIGLNISDKFNFKLYLLGTFYNLFLPGGIGGDGYKIFLLRKKFKIKGRRLFQAIFFDRLCGLWALALITCALVIFIPYLAISAWIPIALALTGTLVYYIVMRRYFTDYSIDFTAKHIKALLVQSLQVVSVIFILYALHFDGKFAPYLLMFLISSLVAIFPFTVGGLGAREIFFLYGAQYFKLDEHLAVLVSLLFYCISAMLSFTGIYFVFRLKDFAPISEAEAEESLIN